MNKIFLHNFALTKLLNNNVNNNIMAESTEDKILAAAEKEFLQKGFAAARTTSIAKEAGVTHAMLHYYFRTKEKLFERIIGNKMSLLGELMMDSLANSELPLFAKIENAIIKHLDFVSANPDLPIFFIREVYSSPDNMKLVSEKLAENAWVSVAKLQAELDKAVEKGECRKVNAEMLLLDIVSLNIFSFVAQPVVETVFPDLFSNKELFLEQRKRENIETIMRKLKI